MRVMFVARAIDRTAGGVERMIVTIMNALAARGHHVELFTWDLGSAKSFYPIASEVTWHRLNMGRPQVRASKLRILHRARVIRDLVRRRKPDAIVCFQDGPFIAMRSYTFGTRIPIIAAERNAPSRFNYITAARYQGLIYQCFRLAARVVVQCESHKGLYPKFLHKRIVCIPNPVPAAVVQAQPAVANAQGRYRLLSVGRLEFQKNYKVLVEAFARIAAKFPKWDLAILGEGSRRAELEALIKAHDLECRVELPVPTRHISEWYASSHLFCLPSLWEGFPNALAEALAHGLPAVAFAECAGARDLVSHGRSGILAQGNANVETLALALNELMRQPDLRRAMGEAAAASVRRYDPSRVYLRWEELLDAVANGG